MINVLLEKSSEDSTVFYLQFWFHKNIREKVEQTP
jgi:hypothetical protein